MKDFKIRCSAMGKIMSALKTITKAEQTKYNKLKAKVDGAGSLSAGETLELMTISNKALKLSKELPQGAKTYCKDWFIEELYGRRKEITSKYMDKGILAEDASLELIMTYENLPYGEKNEEYKEDEFFTGTCDLKYDDMSLIIDAKSSWDAYTFPFFDKEIPNKDYYYQLQGYCQLYNMQEAWLCYALVDMPEIMIEEEIYWKGKKAGGITQEIVDSVRANRTYSDIDPKHRIRSFKFERDDSVIKEIQERVKMCRLYISQLQEEYL